MTSNKLFLYVLLIIYALISAVILAKKFSGQMGKGLNTKMDSTSSGSFLMHENIFRGFNVSFTNKTADKFKNHQIYLNNTPIKTGANERVDTPLPLAANRDNTSNLTLMSEVENSSENLSSPIIIEKRQRSMDSFYRIMAAHASKNSNYYHSDPFAFEPLTPLSNSFGSSKNLKPADLEFADDLESDNFLRPDEGVDYANFETSDTLEGVEYYGWTDNETNHAEIHAKVSEPQSLFLFLTTLLCLLWRFNLLSVFSCHRFNWSNILTSKLSRQYGCNLLSR